MQKSNSNNSTTASSSRAACAPNHWLESTDLIREVATFLVDDAPTLCRLSSVSKSCHAALLLESPRVWKETCRHRWSQKWGFAQRWNAALLQQQQQQQQQQQKQQEDGRWWRDRYVWQEIDAQRTSIQAAELQSLTFDFRFWLSQFWVNGGNLLASGLKWTASQNFSFGPKDDDVVPEFQWPGSEWGRIHGHPSGREDLEWFLNDDGTVMQWGKLPVLWPKGTVHRLPTWGWEIRNPNVCLRAMDSVEVLIIMSNNDDDDDDKRETKQLELVKNDDHSLWGGDYLVSLKRYPTDFGMPQEGIAYMEAPDEFWEFLQNRQRFPRLGIDNNDDGDDDGDNDGEAPPPLSMGAEEQGEE